MALVAVAAGGWSAPVSGLDETVLETDQPLESHAPLEPLEVGVLGDQVLNGAVVRETVTHLGDAFYRRFAAQWRADGIEGLDDVLVVEEQAAMKQGSLIYIRYQRDVIFSARIGPQRSDPETVAGVALEAVFDAVARRLLIQRAGQEQGDPDLAGPEW